MLHKQIKYLVCFILLKLSSIQSKEKSSLTFVIDNSMSMHDDIEAVKKGVIAIFDVVLSSNTSKIDEYILVTFNDPVENMKSLTTKNSNAFKNALKDITLTPNADCPEMSISGIERGLIESRPESLLYVFTDAAAKDPQKHGNVKILAHQKMIQVDFVLTGNCSGWAYKGDEEVYDQIAKETDGQVFHLYHKGEIEKVLAYVQTQVSSTKTVLFHTVFPAGTHSFNFDVDSKMKELVVSVAGENADVSVLYPGDVLAKTKDVAKTKTLTIVKVIEVKPGKYSTSVTSSTKHSIVVTAGTSLHFEHGFSTYEPTAIEETVTRPHLDEPSYLSIKFTTEEDTEKFTLDQVLIMDLDYNILLETPLVLHNERYQFYVSNTTITPPNSLFRVAIKGHDLKTKELITRISLTPIEPQRLGSSAPSKAPIVDIIGSQKLFADFNALITIKCRVKGYPKPDVVWERDDGTLQNSTLSLLEFPYDYVSILSIKRIQRNSSYTCLARNDYGNDRKRIKIVLKPHFNILKEPTGASIEIYKEAIFQCEVDAYPPALINWYKDGRKLREDDNVKISENRSLLYINSMGPKNAGNYVCQVKNDNNRQKFDFVLHISGLEKPTINKAVGEIRALEGSDVQIKCNIIGGKPKPKISWYYKNNKEGSFSKIGGDDMEIMSFERVPRNFTGCFRCEAHNDGGYDFHIVQLVVNYPAHIEEDEEKSVIARVNELLDLPCEVDGEPKPNVIWLRNDTELVVTPRFSLHPYSNGIRFYATEEDFGKYTCRAENEYGVSNKTIYVQVTRPASIRPPKTSKIEVRVGKKQVILKCVADGLPEPVITWSFISAHSKKPRKLKPGGTGYSILSDKLKIKRIQPKDAGAYTCTASNIGGTFNITYEVDVQTPPTIENTGTDTGPFTAVIGDKVLRVPCKAKGNPKPNIAWFQSDLSVGNGYDMVDDTLLIKNVDKKSAGLYKCMAENIIGSDVKYYDVVVEEYPKVGPPERIIPVEQGSSTYLKCHASNRRTDEVRWYKNNYLISSSREHYISDAKESDAGLYTCRVSDHFQSRSGHLEVDIVYGPKFIYEFYDDKYQIEFDEGLLAVMDCRAKGNPIPEVLWWHEDKILPFSGMEYSFKMTLSNRGQYSCLVKNEYGTITRKFKISAKECLLNIQSKLKENQPLILSPFNRWASLESIEGHLKIQSSTNINLFCPSGFQNLYENEITVSCEQDTLFKLNGKRYEFSELQCREEVIPTAKRTGRKCLYNNPDSETVLIGFEVFGNILEVYQTCLDISTATPLYTKHSIDKTIADVPVKEKWYPRKLVPYEIDELYNCELQNRIMPHVVAVGDDCCFSKLQLVNPRDVRPGLPQRATFTALNLVPQWRTCSNWNWDAIEKKVRGLVKYSNIKLTIWTGTLGQLQISEKNITIYDKKRNALPVPKYLWKVVQDSTTKASLAIVQLNIPNVNVTSAYSYLFCKDICKDVYWMAATRWRDVTKGFTFCCSVEEFARVLGEDIFKGSGKVLYDL